MKKNSFIEGTLIATITIVLVKILGMLYVIPFYGIVGETGGALYSYAYNIYLIFLTISSAGLPSAISKVISEYNTLGYQEAKYRAYNIAKKIICFIAIIAFVILMVFAEEIGRFIIGDLDAVNTYRDIAFVIRCVSPAVLIIPFLSITKGYLQGHKYIKPSSSSELIEQVVRIFVILCGSFLCFKVFDGSLSLTIGIAVSGAFFGGLVAYFYLKRIINKNKNQLDFGTITKKDDITDKVIIKKIIYYAIPFVVISLATLVYGFTDQIIILRTLDRLGYAASDVEFIASSISTWAPKICNIITALASGMAIPLIPTIVASHTKNDKAEVALNVNKAISLVISVSLPIAIGICILKSSTWNIFYNNNEMAANILGFAVFASALSNVFYILTSILQSLNKFKLVYFVSVLGFAINALMDVPMMYLFDYLGLHSYLGSIASSILGYTISIIIGLRALKKSEGISYKPTLKILIKSLLPAGCMIVVLLVFNHFVHINSITRIGAVLNVFVNAVLGGSVYLVIAYKMHLLQDVLGESFLNKVIRKITFGKINIKKEN